MSQNGDAPCSDLPWTVDIPAAHPCYWIPSLVIHVLRTFLTNRDLHIYFPLLPPGVNSTHDMLVMFTTFSELHCECGIITIPRSGYSEGVEQSW